MEQMERSINHYKNEIDSVDVFTHASRLQTLLIGLMATSVIGLRREVVAGAQTNTIFYPTATNKDFFIRVGKEKSHRRHGSRVAIPLFLLSFVKLFVKVMGHGNAMEFNQVTCIIKSIIKEFNPYLSITPIEFQRMTLTDVFAGQVDVSDYKDMDTFLQHLGEYLNVTPSVMKRHYNRYEPFKETLAVLSSLNKRHISQII